MSTPFSISNSITYPPDDGAPAVARVADGASSYDVKHEQEFPLTGSGTQAVSFGPLTLGVKALHIEVLANSVAPTTPVNLRFNGGVESLQLTPGGSLSLYNPSPAAGGVISLSIIYTASCTVRIRALG
jgi:hypothetical protein